MNKPEAFAGGIVVLIGALLLFEARKLAYFVENVPGPGFLPLWLSFGIITCGLILTIKALRPVRIPAEIIDWPQAAGWRQVAVMLGALAAALFVLDFLGFVLTAAIFMAALIFSLGVRSWRMLASVPVLGAVGLYLVFSVWLRVPLPQGLLSVLE